MSPNTHGARITCKGQLRTLTAVQRRAAHGISGAFRNSSVNALNAQLHLLPMPLRVEEDRLKTFTRPATSRAYRALKQRRSHLMENRNLQ